MKYLVLILIVFAGIWWIRQQRRPPQDSTQKNTSTPPPVVMVPCTHCGTHVPESDATRGKEGWYCSASHRASHEG
jgi:uncharacterized protein